MQQSVSKSGELHTHSAFSGIDVDSVLDGRRTLGKVLTNTFFHFRIHFLTDGNTAEKGVEAELVF